MGGECMTTERLVVRNFSESDLDELHRLLSDEDVMQFIEPPFTREQSAAFLRTAALCNPPLILAAETKGGRFIGYVIYHPYSRNTYEIGWILLKEHQGKGYADELTKALEDDAKDKAKYLIIECASEQAATKHIALKNGFAYFASDDGRDLYRKELSK